MSSTSARRYKRQKERNKLKGKIEEQITIPTKQDVEEYILNKKQELKFVETIKPLNINLYEKNK